MWKCGENWNGQGHGELRTGANAIINKTSRRVEWEFSTDVSGLPVCPETLVSNYNSTLCKITKERRSHLHGSGILKSHKVINRTFLENWALLGHYAASSGNFLPTFRDNLSVPSSSSKNPWIIEDFGTLKNGTTGSPEISVINYHYSLRSDPEEPSSRLLREENLKSRTEHSLMCILTLSFGS
jgi:hypothetical protein